MVHFLLGKYATPKNEEIVRRIKQDYEQIKGEGDISRRVFWVVPEQKAVLCERRIAESLDASAQLCVEVLNFSRLANKVFRERGGLRHNYITNGSKKLLIYRALSRCSGEREDKQSLCEYKIDKRHERGFVQLFYDAVGELKSYCVTPDALKKAGEGLKNERLKRRISDLALVFGEYESLLGDKYDDPYDDMIALASKVEPNPEANPPVCGFFENATVYISSFDGFTGAQLGVLERIFVQARDTYVALDMEKTDEGKIQYKKISATLSALRELCDKNGIKPEIKGNAFGDKTYHQSNALAYLCENIWRLDAKPWDEKTRDVTLLRPSDEFDECETVASKIKELVMGGARYGEIAVIMRSAEAYRGIIDYCFKKYGIPYFLSVSDDIASKPLIRFIYSAIGAAQDYNTRDVVGFAKSGYVELSSGEEITSVADELEEYICRWGIYGARFERDESWLANPDGYVEKRDGKKNPRYERLEKEQDERRVRIDTARRKIIELLSPLRALLTGEASVNSICVAIYELMKTLGVRDKLREEFNDEKTDAEQREMLKQLYRETVGALDTLNQIMGDEVVTRDGFISALSYVLDEVKIGSIPTGEDNVTVGEAGALRTENIKYAFVLGVCDGEFPQNAQQSSFFTDSDKNDLKKVSIVLSGSTEMRADDELLSFKNAVATPSVGLFVSAPRADIRGSARKPSVAYERIKELFTVQVPSGDGETAPVLMITEEQSELLDKIYTEEIAREYATGSGDEVEIIREALGIQGQGESDSVFSNDSLKVSEECMDEAIGKTLDLSQTKVEKFTKCRFWYYCDFLLGLKESNKFTFGAREVGVLSHAVFENMANRKGKKPLAELTSAEIAEEIERETESYISRLYPKELYPKGAPSKKLEHLFKRLRSNLEIYMDEFQAELKQSEFEPTLFEVRLSEDYGIKPLSFTLEDGRRVEVVGAADRVDSWEHDGKLYVRVVDYKTGEKKFSFDDFYDGLSTQLFIYLSALYTMKDAEAKKRLFGSEDVEIVPAGAMYHPMGLGKASEGVGNSVDRDAERESIKSLVDRRGVFLDDEAVLLAQDKHYAESRSKERILPQKTNFHNKKYFVSIDRFKELFADLEQILKKNAEAILSGDATAAPHTVGRYEDCQYCPNRVICRRRGK